MVTIEAFSGSGNKSNIEKSKVGNTRSNRFVLLQRTALRFRWVIKKLQKCEGKKKKEILSVGIVSIEYLKTFLVLQEEVEKIKKTFSTPQIISVEVLDYQHLYQTANSAMWSSVI